MFAEIILIDQLVSRPKSGRKNHARKKDPIVKLDIFKHVATVLTLRSNIVYFKIKHFFPKLIIIAKKNIYSND